MDLNKKLSILVNQKSFDSDNELSGNVEKPTDTNHEYEETEDFKLGELSIDYYLQDTGYKKKKKKDRKTKKSYKNLFDDVDDETEYTPTHSKSLNKIVNTTKKLAESVNLVAADEFDDFMNDDELFGVEEDLEMRNNLISMGRKYARDSAASKESSEITKTFADSERRLKALYEELDRDKGSLQKDIERLRVPGRGGKNLADMISVKNSMQSTQLSIVKEINALRKNMFEMRQKEAMRKEAEKSGNTDITTNTLQSIFSSSRSGLVNSMGGYSGISGAKTEANEDDYSTLISDEMDDEEIQKRYFNSDTSSSNDNSDGSKFLEYENRGVEYVLLLDDENKVQGVIAEDKDGVMIPDYPMPSNIDELNFEIDQTSMMATDNLHRNYHVRKID